MNFPFYIASRYLVSKKSRNAINIISIISILGVAVGTAALVIVMSVFNGFEDLLTRLNNSFDPDIKVVPVHGKTFVPDEKFKSAIDGCDFVASASYTIEENALLQYDDKQLIATIKGVDDKYLETTGLDTMVVRGEPLLYNEGVSCAIMGAGVAYSMGVLCDYLEPLTINIPSRTKEIHGNFSDAASDILNSVTTYPSGIFAIQQEYDTKYVVLPIDEVRKLLEFNAEVGAVELKLKRNADNDKAVEYLSQSLGNGFQILDRKQQHEYAYKIMQSEKWAIFMILIFILLIASFNIIASITMLIIDKRNDISILRSMGANDTNIRRIFFIEGVGVSLVGAVAGLIFGGLVCWLQMTYGFVKLGGGDGSFIIDAYPVVVNMIDILWSFLAVMIIGLFAAWVPVRIVTRKLKSNSLTI
ncbi:MAG: ABC transporter permease [Bacteroidales bacterium]|nr:ABC transporter permease [Bacteroidales bacterium]